MLSRRARCYLSIVLLVCRAGSFLFRVPIRIARNGQAQGEAEQLHVDVHAGDHLGAVAQHFCAKHVPSVGTHECVQTLGLTHRYNRMRQGLLLDRLHTASLQRDRDHRNGTVFVLQIGAFDGVFDDPLFRHLTQGHRFRALLVEPLPDHFAALQENYARALRATGRGLPSEAGIRFANVAVARRAGACRMRRVPPDVVKRAGLPAWAAGSATLDGPTGEPAASTLTARGRGASALLPHVKGETVRCTTLAALLETNGIARGRVDVLQIDAEGWDFDILQQFFEIVQDDEDLPAIVALEVAHLSASDKRAAAHLLRRHGYTIGEVVLDWVATRLPELVDW